MRSSACQIYLCEQTREISSCWSTPSFPTPGFPPVSWPAPAASSRYHNTKSSLAKHGRNLLVKQFAFEWIQKESSQVYSPYTPDHKHLFLSHFQATTLKMGGSQCSVNSLRQLGSSGGKPGSWLSKANQVPERLLRANQADPFLLSVVTQALLPHSHDPAGCSFNPPTPIYNLKQSKKLPWAGFVIEIVILNPFF